MSKNNASRLSALDSYALLLTDGLDDGAHPFAKFQIRTFTTPISVTNGYILIRQYSMKKWNTSRLKTIKVTMSQVNTPNKYQDDVLFT